MRMTFGVYIHYPYCTRLCPYCDFNVAVRREVPHERYARAVCAEIELRSRSFQSQGAAQTLYFGGGTPGMWPAPYIGAVIEAVDATLGLDSGAEITVEFNPEDASVERIRALAAVGVNRLSLGVQSFDDEHLAQLGRRHTGNEARRAVDSARTGGIDNLSLDLIHGMKGQTLAQALRDVEEAVKLKPKHISTYQLTIEDKTVFGARARRGESLLVPDDRLVDYFVAIRAALCAAGFEPYEISSAARPGYRSRHNTLYWLGSPFLAAGAGAHGFWRTQGRGRRWENERHPDRYMDKALRGTPGVTFEDELDATALLDDDLITGLRMDQGVQVTEAMKTRFGDAAAGLMADGLLTSRDGRWAASDAGRLLLDTLLLRLFASVP